MVRKKIPGYWRANKVYESLFFQYLDYALKFNPATNHLIFSDPRGGSTWLTEILHRITQNPILWEPLNLKKVKEFKDIGFGWRQYIPEDAEWPEANELFDRLFQGKIRNKWIMQAATGRQLLKADAVLIKFCRGNMLLPYLTNKYDFIYKPIYLIRHPFAVVSSQLKHGGWNHLYGGFNIPNAPYNEIYKQHETFLTSLKTKEEALTATWCITNLVPLTHIKNNIDWITINYESLLVNPEAVLNRILTGWAINYDLSNINFNKKSFTTRSGSPVSGKAQLEYWKENLTIKQIDRMESVLQYFEVEAYTRSPEPQIIY